MDGIDTYVSENTPFAYSLPDTSTILAEFNSTSFTGRSSFLRSVNNPLFLSIFAIRFVWIVLVLVFNGLILTAFKIYPEIRSSTGYLVCGLAVADIFGCGTHIMMPILPYIRNSQGWIYICHAKMVAQNNYLIGNIMFSMVIAMERLITLRYPLYYINILTPERMFRFTMSCWVYIVIVSILLLGLNNKHLHQVEQTECLVHNSFSFVVQCVLLVHVYFCLIIVFICYIAIGKIAWNNRYHPSNKTEIVPNAQWRITKTMAIVFLIYGIFYVPALVTDRLQKTFPDKKIYNDLYFLATVTFTANSWINPILFILKTKEYRQAAKKIIPCCSIRSRRRQSKIYISSIA